MELLHKATLAMLVVLGTLPLFTHAQISSESPKSYLQSDSYSLYPPWLVDDQGRLDFSFKTSQLNGLLMYMDSTGGVGHYFKLSLVNGALAAEVLGEQFQATVTTIGEHVNDNQYHSVSVDHEIDANFHITLDGSIPITVPYMSHGPDNVGTSGLYFGGFPDISPVFLSTANSDAHFSGCLMGIRYASDSIVEADLIGQDPHEEVSVTTTCIDPCSGVSCGTGVCVEKYPVGFCDCRGAQMLGAECNEDPAMHAHTFVEGGQYMCYDNVRREPYTGEQTTLSVTLVAPLPQTGTIMTGVSSSGQLQYAVALQSGSFVYKLIRNREVIANISTAADSLSVTYKIEASVNRTFASLTVRDPQDGGSTSPVVRRLIPALTFDPDFENICLGGVELEGTNYVGRIESAYSDYFSLTEQRNFESLAATQAERSNVIGFDVHENEALFFEFQNSLTDAVKMAFDMRTTPGKNFQLLQIRNNAGSAKISLTILNDMIAVNGQQDTNLCDYNVEEGFWHHFEFQISRNPPAAITYSVDCRQQCLFTSEFIGGIDQFLSNPIEFGLPIDTFGDEPDDSFPVCFQNFVFEDRNGAIVRPNLEALTRIGNTFSTTGCFNCTDQQVVAAGCPIDTCQYRDYLLGGQCSPSGTPQLNTCGPIPTTPTTMATEPTTGSNVTTGMPTTAPSETSPLAAGVLAGIVIGSVLAVILLILLAALFVYLCWVVIRNCTGQGFYKTYETNEKNASALRYSASLRELSSEVVLVENNGHIAPAGAMQSNGGHSKEFYL